MDKKLLAMFRKLFALDEQALPDSISPEDFGKLIEKSDGKLFIKPEDFKNLQKVLSEKDIDLKKALEKVEKVEKVNEDKKSDLEKKLDEMSATISTLETTLKSMHTSNEVIKLKKQYPDILPELLAGKTDEEIEKIVDRQREVNKKLYGDSRHFAPPDYSKESDIDEAVNEIKKDKETNSVNSAVSVMNLERKRENLSNSE